MLRQPGPGAGLQLKCRVGRWQRGSPPPAPSVDAHVVQVAVVKVLILEVSSRVVVEIDCFGGGVGAADHEFSVSQGV